MAKEIKDNTNKEELNKEAQEVLLTEEEFARKERAKVKERINRVTRVAGLFAIIILVYSGIFDPLFELSFFGWIWDKIQGTTVFKDGWAIMRNLTILDDIFQFGPWIAELGITIILIAVILLMVYFITYCIVDLIDLIKTFIAAGKDITGDLSGTVKDTIIPSADRKTTEKKEKKTLFSEGIPEELSKKPKRERKKKEEKSAENATDPLTGLSSEQLDALLRGEQFEMPQNNETGDDPNNSEGTKSLF